MDGREDIIPDAGDEAVVAAYIEARRPVCAEVTVEGPTDSPLNYTITPVPDTPEVRAAIAAELDDLHAREAEPGGTLLISHIREAISIAAGETDHTPHAAQRQRRRGRRRDQDARHDHMAVVREPR